MKCRGNGGTTIFLLIFQPKRTLPVKTSRYSKISAYEGVLSLMTQCLFSTYPRTSGPTQTKNRDCQTPERSTCSVCYHECVLMTPRLSLTTPSHTRTGVPFCYCSYSQKSRKISTFKLSPDVYSCYWPSHNPPYFLSRTTEKSVQGVRRSKITCWE